MQLSTSFRSLVVAALGALLVACGGAASSPAKEPAPAMAASDSSCPIAVPGTSVTVEDTATGAALVFVTTGDVVELRRRVGAMAAMHNEHHAKMGALPTGEEAEGGGHAGHDMSGMDHSKGDQGDMGGMMMIHSKASEEDIDTGARLVLVVAPGDIAALGEQLRMHAQQMTDAGTCAMSDHH